MAVSDDFWGFLLADTTHGLLVVGLSGFSPVTATSVVDICHTLPQSMAKCLS